MAKYKDISNMYSLDSIKNSYIISNVKKDKFKTLIYEIKDAILFDINDEIENRIFGLYKEFLRENDYEFKILIRNEKFNIEKYVEYIDDKTDIEVKNSDLYYEFISDLKEKLKNEDIYERKCYIIFSFCDNENSFVDNVENLIQKLREIGCISVMIKDTEKIIEILYEFINKGVKYEV